MDCAEAIRQKITAITNELKKKSKSSETKRDLATLKYQALSAIHDNALTNTLKEAEKEINESIAKVDDITETMDTCLTVLSGGCVDTTVSEITNLAKGGLDQVNSIVDSVTGALDSPVTNAIDSVMKMINQSESALSSITQLDNYINCSADLADSEYIEFLSGVSSEVDGYLTTMGCNDAGTVDFTKTMDSVTSGVVGMSQNFEDTINSTIQSSTGSINTKIIEQKLQAAIVSESAKSSLSVPKSLI